MNIDIKIKGNRMYLASTGKLGVWIPKMEPSATAGEFYQPHSGWQWTGAHLYLLPSGKVVHVQVDWSAIQGHSDSQTVTVFASVEDALKAANDRDEYSPGLDYLADLLRDSGAIDAIPTLA